MVLATVNGWDLTCDSGFYAFYKPDSVWGCPVPQCGTKQEVIDTLKDWLKIDANNEYMLEIENKFLSVLEVSK